MLICQSAEGHMVRERLRAHVLVFVPGPLSPE